MSPTPTRRRRKTKITKPRTALEKRLHADLLEVHGESRGKTERIRELELRLEAVKTTGASQAARQAIEIRELEKQVRDLEQKREFDRDLLEDQVRKITAKAQGTMMRQQALLSALMLMDEANGRLSGDLADARERIQRDKVALAT